MHVYAFLSFLYKEKRNINNDKIFIFNEITLNSVKIMSFESFLCAIVHRRYNIIFFKMTN